jgi:hypothetical protein
VTSGPGNKSVSEYRNVVRGRIERLLAAVDRWGRAVEVARSGTSTDLEATAREWQEAEDQLFAAYHEIPREGS